MKDDVFKAVKDLFCCCKNDEFTENECGMELRRSERSHSTTSVFGSSFRASFVTFKMPSLSGRNSVSESAVTEGNMKDGANNSSDIEGTNAEESGDRSFNFADVSMHF